MHEVSLPYNILLLFVANSKNNEVLPVLAISCSKFTFRIMIYQLAIKCSVTVGRLVLKKLFFFCGGEQA